MCFYFRQTKEALEVAKRFKIKRAEYDNLVSKGNYNGFSYPVCETITNIDPNKISLLYWGLIPTWSKSVEIRKSTLNARIETLSQLKSFKNNLNNRCLIIADGFYEWKHKLSNGKSSTEKFLITTKDNSLFAFAGIYSWWKNPMNQEIFGTFSIITTQANELMSEIHNTKQRMPVILKQNDEHSWLERRDIRDFAFPYSVELKAQSHNPAKEKRGDSMNLLL
jgi:putative SOS response-associated peptidase YedK